MYRCYPNMYYTFHLRWLCLRGRYMYNIHKMCNRLKGLLVINTVTRDGGFIMVIQCYGTLEAMRILLCLCECFVETIKSTVCMATALFHILHLTKRIPSGNAIIKKSFFSWFGIMLCLCSVIFYLWLCGAVSAICSSIEFMTVCFCYEPVYTPKVQSLVFLYQNSYCEHSI